MIYKHKKTGHGYHIRPFETHKRVIDWEAVGGVAFLIFMGLLLIGWLT